MVTIDGVQFHWGMTLVNESGGEIVVSESEFEFKQMNPATWIVSKPSAKHRYMLTVQSFYSSQEARIKFQIKRLELYKSFIDKDIEKLKAGVKPSTMMENGKLVITPLPYLQESYKITEIWEILTPQNCSWLRCRDSSAARATN